jgi:hypothetical protein
MVHVKRLFESRQWYNLIPDQAHTVVTVGYGTYADSSALGDGDLVEDATAGSPSADAATAALSSGAWVLQLAAFAPAP